MWCRLVVISLLENYVKVKNFQHLHSSKRLFATTMSDESGAFKGNVDRYNGVTIDTETESIDVDSFPEQLKLSLDQWRQNSRRTIWFKVKTDHAQIVPTLVENGFDFHHAKRGFVMMFKWLPTDSTPHIPEYAHTMLGVGGIVINDENQILTISENHAVIPGSWKLPGGYVEPNENLIDAVIREVAEETGIQTDFDSLVCVRHALGGPNRITFGFGCSDLYYVFALKPTTQDIKKCEREISKCEWMDFDKYLEHPRVHQMNRHFLRTFIANRAAGIRITSKDHTHELLKRQYQIYSIQSDDAIEPSTSC